MTRDLVLDSDDLSTSVAVVYTVAEAEGTDPLDLPPLYDAIDPDYLDRLGDDPTADDYARFTYAGYRVHATASGDVTVLDSEWGS